MLEMVTATRFDRRMTNGKTKPCLMACDCDDGAEVEVVVKLSGGCERSIGGLATERVNDFAAPFVMNLLCKSLAYSGRQSPMAVG